MRFHRHATALIVALLLARAIASAATLQVAIRSVVQGEPLRLDSLRYQDAAGEMFSVTRLSYLLSGFALEREDGTWVELPGRYAWMDAGQQRMETRLEAVPAGKFRALRFDVGLDSGTNAAPPSRFAPDDPLNPNLNGLHWSWQGGYIFLAMEGRYRSSNGEMKGFAYHLARDPQRTHVHLTAPLDLSHDASVLLDFDVAALLGAPRPLAFGRDGEATHSREGDPIAAALVANLPGTFRVQQVRSSAPEIVQPSPVRPLFLPSKYTPYRFTMNATFPMPDLPRDNPLLEERVTLGRKLFTETALSRDGTLSCASCHQASAAFADSRKVSRGVRNQAGTRNAMPLFNLAWKTSFFWDGRALSLREQALMPIQDHAEMDETLDRVIAKLAAREDYPVLFAAAFGAPEITSEKIGLALENYLLTLTTHDSKFDRALRGKGTLSADEQRGFELFMTEYDPRTQQFGADCFHCHGGPLFTNHQFHNNGLAPSGSDPGRFRVTGRESDRGKFATPSLRNIARTAPYMHDGRFATLDEVIEHYSNGVQRSSTLDPNLAKHPGGGLHLSAADRHALVAFLETLTDESLP